ncbi:Lrp/AsnC family transcriptional regulator [Mucilaginibacter achroorhodeus]|uniref:Lrp/AsnC family transcriptional regulator n=1 Tax=Mucilaginibacter achroorhodeus TaxID=2599294 RepID=A0A563UBI5_9SPHI|nr:Lrp/AsnC family transcriptional regulator [Mucilaginibacter achroorhodeus]TWR28715.1 Lrp/AsnC family transcriptional regulator [Mucilaginibacter achroorhodeus]
MELLDSLDHKILEILQLNNLTSQREIGNKIGLSAPAVQRRITRMRELGVIKKDIAVLNPEHLGQLITIVVQVEMEADKVEMVTKTKRKFEQTPQVQQCYYVTGEADFMLIVVVSNMKEYEKLTHELFFNNPGIQRFKSSICMDIVKSGLALPVPK